jgi:hypothetical protein
VRPHRERPEKGHEDCGTAALSLLFAALRNPEIPDWVRWEVDRMIIQALPPNWRKYTSPSGHFRIFWTDTSPNPNDNVTFDDVKKTALILDKCWEVYAANFVEPKHAIVNGVKRIDIHIRYIDDTTLGQTDPSSNFIELNSLLTVSHPCNRQRTSAHELFHRVQFAYKLATPWGGKLWMAEGTARWSQKFRYPRLKDYMEAMNDGLDEPDANLLQRSYDAAHFWIYLQERAQKKTSNNFSAIRDAWQRYSVYGDTKDAVDFVVNDVWGITFEQFTQTWLKTNYIKELPSPKGYTYTENDDPGTYLCGDEVFGPLHSVPITGEINDITNTTYVSTDGKVAIYGADYWELNLSPSLTNLKITLDGQEAALGGNFSYHLISRKNDVWKIAAETEKNNVVWRKNLAPGEWDQAVVVVGGRSLGGKYTVSVGSCLEGPWTDNFSYVWTLKENLNVLSGTVDTNDCGIFNVTGTKTVGDQVRLTAKRPTVQAGCCRSFSFTGQVNECDNIGGTWSNPCGLSGYFKMTKGSGSASLTESHNPIRPAAAQSD